MVNLIILFDRVANVVILFLNFQLHATRQYSQILDEQYSQPSVE